MYRLASRVTVFRDSQYIGTYDVDGITNADLIKAMVGREIKHLFPKPEVKIGDEMLRIEHLSRTGYFKDVSFNVHADRLFLMLALISPVERDSSQFFPLLLRLQTRTHGSTL